MNGTVNPQKALKERIIFVAVYGDTIVGFVAGHLSCRYECDGELEWIDTAEAYRRNGIASGLINCIG